MYIWNLGLLNYELIVYADAGHFQIPTNSYLFVGYDLCNKVEFDRLDYFQS